MGCERGAGSRSGEEVGWAVDVAQAAAVERRWNRLWTWRRQPQWRGGGCGRGAGSRGEGRGELERSVLRGWP